MLPLSENYLLSPCEVKSLENIPILTGYLSKIREDGIQISGKTDELPILHCDTTVKISIFNSKLGFLVLMGRVYLSTPEIVRIVDVQSETDFEKRNFFRVRVDMAARAHLMRNDRGVGPQGDVSFTVRVQDLSLSGMFFLCGRPLDVEDQIVADLKLTDTVVSLPCRIVRKIKTEQAGTEGFGCEFLDSSGRQYDLLCKYLFDRQREQLRRIKQNLT